MLALGVQPFVTAYVLVELVALLVPPLARLRLEPAGRAKLDRTARIFGLLLASLQAYGVALSLQSLATGSLSADLDVSVPLVTATLIGGGCACLVAAEHVSRLGLVNGPALFLAATSALEVTSRLRDAVTHTRLLGELTPASLVASLVVLAAPCAATWHVLRPRQEPSEVPSTGSPFRDGPPPVATRPWQPILTGSLASLAIASSLTAVPLQLAMLRVPGMEALASLSDQSPLAYEAARLCAGLLVAAALGRRLAPRDAEPALARELGLPLAPSPAGARRAALARTAGYFTVLVAAEHLARTQGVAVSATTMALLAAIGIDAWQGARAASWVPVAWLRQPFAPALLESALAARGIEARTSAGRSVTGTGDAGVPSRGTSSGVSGRCHQPTSWSVPNFQPAPAKVATCTKPRRSCNATLAGLGRVTPAIAWR